MTVIASEGRSLADDWLQTPYKGGHNDLSRWKQYGGTLERPAQPAPIERPKPDSTSSLSGAGKSGATE